MASITREQVLENIQNDWGAYVERFRGLSSEEQKTFLAKQGYPRLGDLLGHVIAWWQACQRDVAGRLADPAFQDPNYDVDAFNARAVEHFSGQDEPAIVEAFEAQRAVMLDFVAHLPEAAFQDHRIVDRLHLEFVGHLQDHAVPG